MNLEGLSLIKVDNNTLIKPFDCGDEDLNDFLLNKAKKYYKELLATSFIIEDEENTIAYYSIFTDSLRVDKSGFVSMSALKRLLRKLVSHPKRHLEYFPAIKIGRLAVDQNIKQSGFGRMIINNIIDFAINLNNECACKLITVDAYEQSLSFYEKIGFSYLSENDKGKDTRQMYLDLTPLINTLPSIEEEEF
ncbi:MAG TPA: GNAT family N-acetyltransferase [Ignavibacteriaceae bacterium]